MPEINAHIRGDLPHDECVSDLMEKFIAQGLPVEIAAKLAEDVVTRFEASRDHRMSQDDIMLRMMKRSHRIMQIHLISIGFCVILAVINTILAFWTLFLR